MTALGNSLLVWVKGVLSALGLLPMVRYLQHLVILVAGAVRPDDFPHRQRFLQFERQYGAVLRHRLVSVRHARKRVLVLSIGFPEVEFELALIKALELAGHVPVTLVNWDQKLLTSYYKLARIKDVYSWSSFLQPRDLGAAEDVIRRCRSLENLLSFEYAHARVGKFALSSAIRKLRVGSLDIQSLEARKVLVNYLAWSMAYAEAAQKILKTIDPCVALYVDGVYTPEGELIDNCLARGIDAISWDVAHKSNALMLKRYSLETREQHPWSLSPESWQFVCGMEWSEAHRRQLEHELYGSYASGDWYSVNGTQFNKNFMDADTIRTQLGLDPTKKTAFIFSHILWDASLFFGKDLFDSFEAWLVETVRVACANDQVNWVIKIHPAHIGKAVKENFHGEPAEVVVLRERIGALPPHVTLIPPETDINTFSLFAVMDYCLTVRGTVGIEAARLGIPVLTAGTGRYSHKGFTIDSESRQRYLERLAQIQHITRLTPSQQELAERFAYGTFVLRPFPFTTVTLEYHKKNQYNDNGKGNSKTQVNIKGKEAWHTAADLRAFARWVTDPMRSTDYLLPL